MGVSGLLPLLKNASRQTHIKDFKGSTAAIDGYCWLHRGAFSCAEKLVLGEQTDRHIKFCMKLIKVLQSNGVRPLVVFDGKSLPSKAETNKKRSETKKENRAKARMLFAEGRAAEAKEMMRRCVEITAELAFQFIVELRRNHIDYVVAPYEADAQLAFLNLNGYADLVISEDSDLMLFGCERVFYKMDANGYGTVVEKAKIPQCLGSGGSTHFTHDKFRWACILSGCDYVESLPGIGLKKALKFLKPTSNTDPYSLLRKIPIYLKMPTITITDDYIDRFVKADNTFLYQLVFCPTTKKLRPLNDYPPGVDGIEMPYAGTYYDQSIVVDIALGNVHLRSHQPMGDPYYPDNGIIVRKSHPIKSATHSKISAFSFTRKPKTNGVIEIRDEHDVKLNEEMVSEVIQLYETPTSSQSPPIESPVKRRSLLEDLESNGKEDVKVSVTNNNMFKKKKTSEPVEKIDKIVSRFFVSNLAPHTQVVAVKRKASSQQDNKPLAKRQVSLKDLFK